MMVAPLLVQPRAWEGSCKCWPQYTDVYTHCMYTPVFRLPYSEFCIYTSVCIHTVLAISGNWSEVLEHLYIVGLGGTKGATSIQEPLW